MNKLQLIDADTLYYKPLAHPKMLIDGVLSDGLAILAGDSKIGKSWMVLWLCLQISRGEAVWGLPTRKTDVVYLALEDREWRVQQRMQELTDSPPENLRFGFSCGQLGAELEGQIEETLREFPSTGLIFIDTLQMVRDNLDTPEDVQRFLARMDKEMDAISAARSKIRNKQRGCADPAERVELKKSCAACTAELSRLRKQKQTAYNMIEDLSHYLQSSHSKFYENRAWEFLYF